MYRPRQYNLAILPSEAQPIPLEVRLFGGFDVLVNGSPMPPLRSRREGWLLGLLVLRHRQATSREWLASTLWPDNLEEQALFYLRKSLSNLRRAMGQEAERISAPSPRTLRLDLTGVFTDVIAFDRAVERGSKADLEEAVACYRGPLLPDCQEEWACLERGQREQAYHTALERLAALSDPAAAVRWLRLLVSSDPYRESAYRAFMQALADCGDRAAVTVVFRELRERLHQDLNAAPLTETETLYRELRQREGQAVASPALSSAPVDPRRHLPVPLTELIGRSSEIEEVLEWMAERRLVTLVGAGGIGKTRLSIAVAEAVLPRFEDGVWFVDLAPIADRAVVQLTVGKALGVAEDPTRPVIDTMIRELRNRRVLVVLDNCEHLVEACAELAQLLLTSCPMLAILATSRQPLHVTGEQVFRVPGLPVPPGDSDSNSLLGFESIRLFVDRGSRVDSSFRLNDRNSSIVVEICRQLDGIPLAIELAAARIRSMSAKELGERLDQRFQLLKGASRATIPRQQTLRSLIDWSYDLLNEQEKALLCRLSVFAGGWTLDAAEQVCSGAPIDRFEVLDILTSLVDKSLVLAEGRDGSTRYGLLETVKHYALDRLSGEAGGWRRRHGEYFAALADRAEPNLIGPDEQLWLNMLEAEHDNLRSAFAWSTEEGSDPETALGMCGALWVFRLARGFYEEGRTWCRVALELANEESETIAYAAALNCAAVMAYKQGDINAARPLHEHALAVRRRIGDLRGVAQSLNGLGILARAQGDFESTAEFHREAFAIRRELGDPLLVAQSLLNLGDVAFAQGNYDSARRFLEESLSTLRELGTRRGTGLVLQTLGSVLFEQGDYAPSRSVLEEALLISREFGERMREAECLMGLGEVAHQAGDLALARAYLADSLSIRRDLREPEGIALSLNSLADLEMASSSYLRGSRLWGAAEAVRDSYGGKLTLGEQTRHDCRVVAARTAFGDDSGFDAAWQEGLAMGMEQAIAYALSDA